MSAGGKGLEKLPKVEKVNTREEIGKLAGVSGGVGVTLIYIIALIFKKNLYHPLYRKLYLLIYQHFSPRLSIILTPELINAILIGEES